MNKTLYFILILFCFANVFEGKQINQFKYKNTITFGSDTNAILKIEGTNFISLDSDENYGSLVKHLYYKTTLINKYYLLEYIFLDNKLCKIYLKYSDNNANNIEYMNNIYSDLFSLLNDKYTLINKTPYISTFTNHNAIIELTFKTINNTENNEGENNVYYNIFIVYYDPIISSKANILFFNQEKSKI